jgi:tetratricopeptide (TPR) repeat protein
LFDSITAFLKTASQRQPLVLVLDDLHWADQPSLALLQFVARELNGARLLIIGTYRDMELSRQHPLAEALGELNRERLFQRVLLRGLTQEDVSRFIEMTSGNAAPRGLVEAVHTQTEGNPLFVTEIVRLLVQEGALTPDSDLPSASGTGAVGEGDSWTIRIPEGVREVIGRRLNRLSQRCNEALTVASLIGREFTSSQLDPLIEEMTEDRLFEVLEEALAARVIEEFPQAVGRYQFTHALIQETLTAELSLTRRVRLHARIAETLEAMYGDDADSHAAELAHHFTQAEAALGTDRLAHYCLVAGERALAAYAFDEALNHLSRALVAKHGDTSSPGPEQITDDETAAIFLGLGYAQTVLHQTEHAISSFHRAFDFYASAGNVAKAVEIAGYGHSGELIIGLSDLTRRAMEMVDLDSHDAGQILASHGYALGSTTEGYQDGMAAMERALAISQRESDRVLEARTQANMANIHGFHLRWKECLEIGLLAVEHGAIVDDFQSEMRGRLWVSNSLIAIGEADQAAIHAGLALESAERRHDRLWIDRVLLPMLAVPVAKGDWHSALLTCDRYPHRNALLFKEFIERHQGSAAAGQGQSRLHQVLGLRGTRIGPTWSTALLMAAVTARTSGDLDLLASVESAVIYAASSWSVPLRSGAINLGLAIVATEKGDRDSAKHLYGAIALEKLHLSGIICADRVLGLLAHTSRDLDKAPPHFEDALVLCREAGYRPELAWTCCDYADTLRERDAEGDRAKAISLLDESLAISSELGMRPLMERVLSRREILKA